MTLLVLAAGMGSRFGGLKQIEGMGPKGETLLDYSVFDAINAGFKKVVFLIRNDIEQIFRERVGTRYGGRVEVAYAFQELTSLPAGFEPPVDRVKPWGTGHAIWCARHEIGEPFAAINADDFYGRSAFTELARFLSQRSSTGAVQSISTPSDPEEFAMVGYELARTLSETGSVSRGLRRMDDANNLSSIEEITGIQRDGTGIRGADSAGTERRLEETDLVSMNCWAFTPAVFGLLDTELRDFLAVNGAEQKSEFYIPTAIANMMTAGRARVKMLRCDARWFGVTHRDDLSGVRAAIAQLVDDGTYPSQLW